MKRFPAMAVIAAFTLGILTATAVDTLWPAGKPAAQVTEDSAGWDCATMGNRVCASDLVTFTDMSQPYDRCLAALDGAHVPIGLCGPLKP